MGNVGGAVFVGKCDDGGSEGSGHGLAESLMRMRRVWMELVMWMVRGNVEQGVGCGICGEM